MKTLAFGSASMRSFRLALSAAIILLCPQRILRLQCLCQWQHEDRHRHAGKRNRGSRVDHAGAELVR